jgi:hypothetical protein
MTTHRPTADIWTPAETPDPRGPTAPGSGTPVVPLLTAARPEGTPLQPLPLSTVRRLAVVTSAVLGGALLVSLALAPEEASASSAPAADFIATGFSSPAVYGGEPAAADAPNDRVEDLVRSLPGGDVRVLPGEDAWVIETIADALGRQLDDDRPVTNNRTRTFTEVPR